MHLAPFSPLSSFQNWLWIFVWCMSIISWCTEYGFICGCSLCRGCRRGAAGQGHSYMHQIKRAPPLHYYLACPLTILGLWWKNPAETSPPIRGTHDYIHMYIYRRETSQQYVRKTNFFALSRYHPPNSRIHATQSQKSIAVFEELGSFNVQQLNVSTASPSSPSPPSPIGE